MYDELDILPEADRDVLWQGEVTQLYNGGLVCVYLAFYRCYGNIFVRHVRDSMRT